MYLIINLFLYIDSLIDIVYLEVNCFMKTLLTKQIILFLYILTLNLTI